MSIEEKIAKYPAYPMTRVTGWYVNKAAMNPGKQAEFNDRKYYSISLATKEL